MHIQRNNIHKIRHNKRGFTLLETLVAISILLVGLSAAFAVAQSGLSSSNAVKDRITAIFLAQEGLEAVKNAKDSNLLAQNLPGGSSSNPDFIFGVGCASPTHNCDYSYSENPGLAFIQCDALCEALRINSTGLFNHSVSSGDSVSRFSRTIQILPVSGTRSGQSEARVIVLIKWPCANLACTGTTAHTYVAQENISNWFGP